MRISEITSNHLVATPELVNKAKQFLLMKWKDRSKERGSPDPTDLSSACKFASLFAQQIFGGKIQGNWHHQYNVLPDGKVLDLTEPSKDIIAIQSAGHDPYIHDKSFWNNYEHRESMKSCKPRVNAWVKEFSSNIK